MVITDSTGRVQMANRAAFPPGDAREDWAIIRALSSPIIQIWDGVLTVPVIAMAMVPAWQFTNWQWASLTLAAPVVVWGAWPFHRAAAINLRHGAATMDTLISLGTLAESLLRQGQAGAECQAGKGGGA
mgnify:CR=1 FL=1